MPRTQELPLPSQAELRKLFRYDGQTGKLFWKYRPRWRFADARQHKAWNTKYAYKEAFISLCNGHLRGMYNGQRCYAHRVIWKYKTGEEPPEIDHIDGDPTNNRWENLRAANRAINSRNMPQRKDNTSGVTGVHARGDRWITQIMDRGQVRHVGIYATKAEAIAARRAAEIMLSFHPNHGRHGGAKPRPPVKITRRGDEDMVELGSFATREEAVAAYRAAEKIRDQREDFSEDDPSYQ
jgi:hypothetical protein